MHDHMHEVLTRAEAVLGSPDALYGELRKLPIQDFGHLMFAPSENHPALSRTLPRLPDPQIQRNYVGNDGVLLEQLTASFLQIFAAMVQERFGATRNLDLKILDYGCGWGRILRMMPYFVTPSNVYGTDPLQQSLDLCRETGVKAKLQLCDFIPRAAPFPGVKFDIAYAFSVFTHTSKEVSSAILDVVRQSISDKGLFVITVRPVEFWPVVNSVYGTDRTASMEDLHKRGEYAFLPSSEMLVDGKATFGDTSLSLPALEKLVGEHGWRMGQYQRGVIDPYQIIVPLTPA